MGQEGKVGSSHGPQGRLGGLLQRSQKDEEGRFFGMLGQCTRTTFEVLRRRVCSCHSLATETAGSAHPPGSAWGSHVASENQARPVTGAALQL